MLIKLPVKQISHATPDLPEKHFLFASGELF